MFDLFAQKRTYLDYASATPVLPEALHAMKDAERLFGNPGAIHEEGVQAATLLQESREKIAREFGVKAREIIFTTGGTESNNLAILGFARAHELRSEPLDHWIVSSIEHPSVLECFAEIERKGGDVTFVDPDACGVISEDLVRRALRPETVFVSLQWANHEIGTIEPLRAVARVIREFEKEHASRVVFHSDFGQALLYLSPQIHTLGVDIASIDSGKLYGPRGIGALYVDNRVVLAPLILGGGQERGLRAGTENVVLASGFAKALRVVSQERDKETVRVRELRDELARGICARIPDAVVNGSTSLTAGGDLKHALPHLLNISIPDVSSEYVTLALDRAGIAISTKSACKEGEARSHVVGALYKEKGDEWRAAHTLRFSLGRDTTKRDVTRVADALSTVVARMRAMH